jgi:SNF2 family DNA or RNA helicase
MGEKMRPIKAIPYNPHHYQSSAKNFCLESIKREGAAALFLNVGLGKTSITLSVFKELKDAGTINTMLIVAPLRVAQTTWPAEIAKWADFNNLTYVVVHGPNKQQLLNKKVDIYIINYEGLPWLTTQKWDCADMLVFDELTRMKNWTSQRVKAIKPFLYLFKVRLGLTGTPAPNGLQDLFSQIYMLDLGKRFGSGITKFRDKYFKPPSIYQQYKREPYDFAIQEIYDKIKDLAFRIDAKDWITLPEEIHNVIPLELPANLKKDYIILKKEFILTLECCTSVTASSAAALSTKLRQFLSGSIYTESGITNIHAHKLEALKDFIDDMNGNPVLIAYQYRHEATRFKQAFPSAEFITSTTSVIDLCSIIKRWNKGEIPVLFGHPQSVGHGLNLQGACNNILFYSLDFNLENYLQFIGRVSRQGQLERHVMIHYLTFIGTIDEYLLSVLKDKTSLQATLLDFLRVDLA